MTYSMLPTWASAPAVDTRRDAASLLQHYSFDLGNRPLPIVVAEWQSRFSLMWIRMAIVEALYLGRYKAVSVEQILQQWTRKQQPKTHFSYEFEHLVCDRVPRDLSCSDLDTDQGMGVGARSAQVPAWIALAKRIQEERQESQLAETPSETKLAAE